MADGEPKLGTAGNNTIFGTSGDDQLYGLDGDDVLHGLGGADQLVGGEGMDTASYSTSTGYLSVTINLKTGEHTGHAEGDTFVSIEKFRGTKYNDTFVSGLDKTSFDGYDGSDVISYSTSDAGVNVDLTSGVGAGGDADGDTYTSIELVIGSAYSDTLSSSTPYHALSGRGGNDVYIIGAKDISVYENANGGIDEVRTALISHVLADEVENLSYTGTVNFTGVGNNLANLIIGGSGADTLSGNDGNDTLNGMGGNDTLIGGLGNDTYIVDSVEDDLVENAGEGTDGVRTILTNYTLGSEIENLRYTGSAAFTGTGNALANNITGAGANDTLDGGAGNDVLNGAGGSDQMIGGTGNDVYVVDSTGDTVTEIADEGTDEIQTGLSSYSLRANVENLRYTGSGSFVANGNALNNTIYGKGGDDTLYGGTGADVLYGGAGDDTYRVEIASDQVFEDSNAGFDTILSDNSFALAAGQEIEVLRLTTASSTTSRNLAGNEFDNTLIGNAGVNSMDGGGGNDVLDGGAGADTLNGGDGIDTVSFASFGSRVTIAINDGATWDGEKNDTLISIENAIGSAFNDTLAGDDGANVLDGGDGNDTMRGGLGNDVLTGGNGSDTFHFRSALGSNNVDRIVDFVSGGDSLLLDKAYMTGLSAGALAASAFKNISQSAADADDRILYKQTTGEVFYDADGSGSGAAVRFVILDNKAALTYQDILVM